jgi:FkbM family methyltransferase
MREQIVASLLSLYERASKRGLLDNRPARRAFESAYLGYKLLIEAGPIGQLQCVVASGSTVIDVGANIGFFALRFGRWVGPSGRVVAIEPERRNVATLRRRVRRARLDSVVECVHAAAADQPGELRLAVDLAHPGGHRLAEDGEPVSAVTLDQITRGDSRRVSLVKIDVQGAEKLVLTGARHVIATHRPAVFVELDDAALGQFGSSVVELIEVFERLGYSGHTLTRRGIVVADSPKALATKSADRYIDVLFMPRRPLPRVDAAEMRADHLAK